MAGATAQTEAPSQDDELAAFEAAKKFFRAHRRALLGKYRGRYIAIIGGEVVDVDDDSIRLALRVYKRFGYRAIYMPFVSEKPEVAHIHSPRTVSQP